MAFYQAFPQDIELAIKQALSNFTVTDENGNTVKVPVFYTNPESEIVVESHPSIVFYQVDVVPDRERMRLDYIYDGQVYDSNGNLISVNVREDADPYIITYDIRIYTLYQQDLKQLERYIMTTFPMRGTLNVNGNLLDMFLYKRVDLTKGPESLNSSSIRILEKTVQREQVISLKYKVHTAFDVHQYKTMNTVNTVSTNTNTK